MSSTLKESAIGKTLAVAYVQAGRYPHHTKHNISEDNLAIRIHRLHLRRLTCFPYTKTPDEEIVKDRALDNHGTRIYVSS